jgi:hypothetical protein
MFATSTLMRVLMCIIMLMYVCIIFLVCFIKLTINITLLDEPCHNAVDPLNHIPVNAILEVICNVSYLG